VFMAGCRHEARRQIEYTAGRSGQVLPPKDLKTADFRTLVQSDAIAQEMEQSLSKWDAGRCFTGIFCTLDCPGAGGRCVEHGIC